MQTSATGTNTGNVCLFQSPETGKDLTFPWANENLVRGKFYSNGSRYNLFKVVTQERVARFPEPGTRDKYARKKSYKNSNRMWIFHLS